MPRPVRAVSDQDLDGFLSDVSEAIRLLRRASDRSSRSGGLGSNQRRRQRGLVDIAIRNAEAARRLASTHEERSHGPDHPVLTKYSLASAAKELKSLDKVARHFGMSTGAIRRTMRMFGISFDVHNFGG